MKVTLRELTLNDTDKIVRWRNQDFVLENFIDRTLITNASHISYFHQRVETGLVKQFIIECDGVDIGTTFLRDIDHQLKQAEFGIFIGEKDYLSKGIGAMAAKLIVNYGFDELNLKKIFLRVLTGNVRAQRSYEKVGFHLDDQNKYLHDDGIDEIFMVIEKGD